MPRTDSNAPAGAYYTFSVVCGTDSSEEGYSVSALSQASSVVQLPSGNFVIAEAGAHRLRLVQPGGKMTTMLGGSGARGPTRGLKNGNLRSAMLAAPADMCVAPDGSLVVADSANNCLRIIAGCSTVQQDTQDFAADIGWQPKLQYSSVQTLAGDSEGGSADGADASKCRLVSPSSLVLTDEGMLIADTGNHVLRLLLHERLQRDSKEKGANASPKLFGGPVAIVAGKSGVCGCADGAGVGRSLVASPHGLSRSAVSGRIFFVQRPCDAAEGGVRELVRTRPVAGSMPKYDVVTLYGCRSTRALALARELLAAARWPPAVRGAQEDAAAFRRRCSVYRMAARDGLRSCAPTGTSELLSQAEQIECQGSAAHGQTRTREPSWRQVMSYLAQEAAPGLVAALEVRLREIEEEGAARLLQRLWRTGKHRHCMHSSRPVTRAALSECKSRASWRPSLTPPSHALERHLSEHAVGCGGTAQSFELFIISANISVQKGALDRSQLHRCVANAVGATAEQVELLRVVDSGKGGSANAVPFEEWTAVVYTVTGGAARRSRDADEPLEEGDTEAIVAALKGLRAADRDGRSVLLVEGVSRYDMPLEPCAPTAAIESPDGSHLLVADLGVLWSVPFHNCLTASWGEGGYESSLYGVPGTGVSLIARRLGFQVILDQSATRVELAGNVRFGKTRRGVILLLHDRALYRMVHPCVRADAEDLFTKAGEALASANDRLRGRLFKFEENLAVAEAGVLDANKALAAASVSVHRAMHQEACGRLAAMVRTSTSAEERLSTHSFEVALALIVNAPTVHDACQALLGLPELNANQRGMALNALGSYLSTYLWPASVEAQEACVDSVLGLDSQALWGRESNDADANADLLNCDIAASLFASPDFLCPISWRTLTLLHRAVRVSALSAKAGEDATEAFHECASPRLTAAASSWLERLSPIGRDQSSVHHSRVQSSPRRRMLEALRWAGPLMASASQSVGNGEEGADGTSPRSVPRARMDLGNCASWLCDLFIRKLIDHYTPATEASSAKVAAKAQLAFLACFRELLSTSPSDFPLLEPMRGQYLQQCRRIAALQPARSAEVMLEMLRSFNAAAVTSMPPSSVVSPANVFILYEMFVIAFDEYTGPPTAGMRAWSTPRMFGLAELSEIPTLLCGFLECFTTFRSDSPTGADMHSDSMVTLAGYARQIRQDIAQAVRLRSCPIWFLRRLSKSPSHLRTLSTAASRLHFELTGANLKVSPCHAITSFA